MSAQGARSVLAAAAFILLVACGGCSSATYVDESGNAQDRFDDGGWRFNTMNVITDERTGVQYLIVEGFDNEMAVCPLYNADGTLCTE